MALSLIPVHPVKADAPALVGHIRSGSIGAGWNHSLAVRSNGTAVAWGLNTFGQRTIPATNANYIAVAGGGHHSMGLKNNGSIAAWGRNIEGQTNVPSPNADFIAIAAGGLHSLGLKDNGSVMAWGLNTSGQTNVPSPNSGFIEIAAGWIHSLALKTNGVIVGWGGNGENQLNVPAPNSNFIAVAAGGYHSLGLKTDGAIVAWGRNNEGQCNVPAPNANFIAVAGGLYHSVGLKADGAVVVWGDNSFNQSDLPAGNSNVVLIAANGYHTLALKSDGVILAWGRNTDNQTNVPTNENYGIRGPAVSPAIGTTDGGYDVLINGYFLGGDVTNVTLVGVDVSSISSQSSTHILVVAGAAMSPAFGGVVAYSSGDGELSIADAFRYRGLQSISFPEIPGQSVFAQVVLEASASSGLPVSYSVLAGPATIADGSNVTFTGYGEVFIQAEQDGDDDWYAAAEVIRNFVVTGETATVTIHDLNQIYNGSPRLVTATTDPNGLDVVITYNGVTNVPVNAGNYIVTGRVADAFYTGAATGLLVVGKADQTITFDPISDKLSTTQFVLIASASSGLPVSFDAGVGPVIISGGSNVSFTGSGIVSILATQSGDGNWNPAPSVTNVFNVLDDFYYLALVVGPNGSVNVADGFKPAFSNIIITATPAPYHAFAGWGGNVAPADAFNNPLIVNMSGSKTVTVSFAETTTSGGVSIPWLVGLGFTTNFEAEAMADHDDDGVSTGDEYFADTAPFDIESFLSIDVIALTTTPSGIVVRLAGVVSTNRVYDLQYREYGASNPWQPVSGYTNLIPDGEWLSITNPPASPSGGLFRLEVRKP